jgi:hypothetical protein
MELELLRHRLEQALRVFRNTDQRLGSGHAVVAVCDFLGSLGIEPRLRVPLQSLIADMADDLTKDARKPLFESFHWAKAAAAIDILKGADMDLKAAAKAVSKATGIEPSQLMEFRKNIRKGRARDEANDAYWRTLQQEGEQLKQLAPKDRIKVILAVVRQVVVAGKKG